MDKIMTQSARLVSLNARLIDEYGTEQATDTFELYLKTYKLKQALQSLQHVAKMPRAQREAWVEEHEDLINQLLDDFVQDSTMVLNGTELDADALDLSIDFVISLRETMSAVQTILEQRRKVRD